MNDTDSKRWEKGGFAWGPPWLQGLLFVGAMTAISLVLGWQTQGLVKLWPEYVVAFRIGGSAVSVALGMFLGWLFLRMLCKGPAARIGVMRAADGKPWPRDDFVGELVEPTPELAALVGNAWKERKAGQPVSEGALAWTCIVLFVAFLLTAVLLLGAEIFT